VIASRAAATKKSAGEVPADEEVGGEPWLAADGAVLLSFNAEIIHLFPSSEN
jgi:hypothetical protein